MKTPKRLEPLLEDGLIDEVVAQLKSGKEATVYLVRCGEKLRCAKVYKDANHRSFRQATVYREGRKTRSSRDARAMAKGSKHGREELEDSWQHAEVNALYRLADAGVRVPTPYGFHEGVLLMEMVDDGEGNPAPRLGDLDFTPEAAVHFHAVLVQEVVRMLCAGLVHGDLSEYNILFDAEGPVIIDLPQAVDAAANAHARGMLERDVRNLAVYFGQYAPELLQTNYEKEIWDIFESGELTPETHLTGQAEEDDTLVDLVSIFAAIDDAKREEAQRRAAAAEQDE